MSGTIINKSSKAVQVYSFMQETTTPPQVQLDKLLQASVTFVGSNSTGDLFVQGVSNYLYIAVWKDSSKSGEPNSWLIADTAGKIITNKFRNFNLELSGNYQTGWVITIQNETDWMVLGLFLLIILTIAAAAFWFWRQRNRIGSIGFSTDLDTTAELPW